MRSQRPPRLGEAGADQHGCQQRDLHFADGGEHASAPDHHGGVGTVKSAVSRAVAKLRIDAELGEDSGA